MTNGSALILPLCLTGIGIGLSLAQGAVRRSRAVVVDAVAVVTGLAFLGPFLGWTLGLPAERETAAQIGLILAMGCLPLVVAAGWWAGRDPAIADAVVAGDPRWPDPDGARRRGDRPT